MKFLYSCFLLLTLIVVSQSYSASWGRRLTTDILIYRRLERYAPIRNKVWCINTNFPEAGKNDLTISNINVFDNYMNNSGAEPSIRSGGVGYRYAQVNLKSKINQGIDSTVEIWGRY